MSIATTFKRRGPIAGLVILIGLAAFNIYLPLFIVPKFEQIYQDALPGQPLPGMTVFVIAGRIPLALVALVWPVAASILAWKSHRATGRIVTIGYFYFLALIVLTIIALFMPMAGSLITGKSYTPLTNAVSSP